MDARACGYAHKGDIHQGRVGAGLTLTGRHVGGIAGAKGVAKAKNAKRRSSSVAMYYTMNE
jgi:hypothetical protein